MRAPYFRARIFFMWNFKKVVMMLLVIFGPLSFFYFLSRGKYHFTELPYLYDSNNHKPEIYEKFEVRDQYDSILNQDYFNEKFTVINYMDKTCPYGNCKIDAKMMRLEVYRELLEARGFNDVVIVTEVNDPEAANRKVIQDVLGVDGSRWKFVYSENFSFFNLTLNGTNPYTTNSIELETRKMFNLTMRVLRKMSNGANMKPSDREKLEDYFKERIYERSLLILDKSLRIRSYLNSSESIEFKRVMEELRLLKKEYSKKEKALK